MNLKYQLLVHQNKQKRREKTCIDKLSSKRTNKGRLGRLRREIGHPLREVAVEGYLGREITVGGHPQVMLVRRDALERRLLWDDLLSRGL